MVNGIDMGAERELGPFVKSTTPGMEEHGSVGAEPGSAWL